MKTWSWGNIPTASHKVYSLNWRNEVIPFEDEQLSFLPYGYGRSYGDVPVNDKGAIVKVSGLNRFIEFDPESGILHSEAGARLDQILEFIVPRGWFLPVSPGTQYVSLGGAVANDIHGKNHRVAGTFGCHVIGFELLRSDIGKIWCSQNENPDLFSATIGGLGLTGLVLSVKVQLLKIESPYMETNNFVFSNIQEGLELFKDNANSSYSVAWIDCLQKPDSKSLGRGLFTTAEHSNVGISTHKQNSGRKLIVPFFLPAFTLNRWTVKCFNQCYYQAGKTRKNKSTVHYESFFYPLDKVVNWNRIYGKAGFYQYQCLIPHNNHVDAQAVLKEMLIKISKHGNASFLAVLKSFGNIKSPGMLSFPREGFTFALDFPNQTNKTLELLESLDTIVKEASGRVYPAKDARMSKDSFQEFFPEYLEFNKYTDPKFSSSFWRRVTG